FRIHRRLKKLVFTIITLLPPIVCSMVVYKELITFSTIVSSFAEYFLATIIPISWIWNLRYRLELPYRPVVWGGRKILVVLIFFTVFLLFVLGIIPIHQIDW